MNNGFYVGYLPKAPPATARLVRRVCVGLFLAVVVVGAILVVSQGRFPTVTFEYGVERGFSGTISASPVPSLMVTRPGETAVDRALSRYLLTIPGKRGALEQAAGFDGQAVNLHGTLIYRNGTTMIEVVEGTMTPTGAEGVVLPTSATYGTVTVVGEIVDGKCFLGVMNPGEGKPHRACAARCISGGAPPLMVVRSEAGDYRYLLLVGPAGEPVHQDILSFVAEPVEITGNLVRSGDAWLLYADPATIRRVS